MAGVLPNYTNRALDGGAVARWAWRFLMWEWTRLRRLMTLLRAVSVALFILRSRCTVAGLLFYRPAHQNH